MSNMFPHGILLQDEPCAVDTGRLCLVQSRHFAAFVEPNNQSADTEGADTTALRVPLLYASHVFCDVLDSHWVFHREAVRLRL